MKILIVGSSGFIGRKVREVLSASHDVYAADRSGTDQGDNYFINLGRCGVDYQSNRCR